MQTLIDGMEDFMAEIDEPVDEDLYDPYITYKTGFDAGCRFAIAALAFRYSELRMQFDLSEIEETDEPVLAK